MLEEADIVELLRRWREPPVYDLAADVERQLADVLASLEHMASRDSIRNGRMWMECNSAIAPQIAGHIMKRISFIPTCAHRLHVLYLVHDVLQTEAARKDGVRPLIRAFKPYLLWILRPAYQLALSVSPNGEESQRVLRLLQLWVERAILVNKESEEFRILIQRADLTSAQAASRRMLSSALPRPTAAPTASSSVARPSSAPRGASAVAQQLRPVAGAAGYAGQPAAHYLAGQRPGFPVAGVAVGQAYLTGQRPPYLPPNQVILPGTVLPGLRGYRPHVVPPGSGKQTPETVPVGVMATMLAQYGGRKTGDFVPYRSLDPKMTPQLLPPMEVPTQRLLERVEDFYQDLRDEESDDGRSSSSRSSSRSRSRSRSKSKGGTMSTATATGTTSGTTTVVAGTSAIGAAIPPPAVD